jgi:hypothetical protein
MDKNEIEILRMMQEQGYREIDSSAIVVAELGVVDYSTNETIKKYTNEGYKLFDTNKFGVGPLQCGEFLVFVKKK